MILRKKIIRSIAAITATLSMLALPIASANAEEIVTAISRIHWLGCSGW